MELINPILANIAFGLAIIAFVFILHFIGTRTTPHKWYAVNTGERSESNH
jgi:hypothetical protein